MAAPSGTQWGSTINDKHRIGLYLTTSSDNSNTYVTAEVWIWTKYTIHDSNNNLYFDWDSQWASSNKGNVNIYTTVNSGGGWSTTNQQKLATYNTQYARQSNATKYVSAALSGLENSPGTTRVTSSFSITGVATYAIYYNANGGFGAPSTQIKYHDQSITLSNDRPYREGYTFLGWGTSSSSTYPSYQPGQQFNENYSTIMYAVWSKDSYTVSYNANGGSGAPEPQVKSSNSDLTLSSTVPQRKRHKFLGWSTSKNGQPEFKPGGQFSINSNTVLYASWKLLDDSIVLYSSKILECIAYVENSSVEVEFSKGGVVECNQFVEGDSEISISNNFNVSSLEEV